MEGLRVDLGPLLVAAQYRRAQGAPAGPRNSITSVDRISDAVRAHSGVGYVVLAEREDDGESVAVRALYVLEGAPIGGPGGTGSQADAPATADAPAKAGFVLDLNGEAALPLVRSLHGHLGALLQPAGQGPMTAVEDAIAALQAHTKVSYVMLTERRGESSVDRTRVIVVPDVLRISISDDATPAAPADPPVQSPEVELVPRGPGDPPVVKFRFDPDMYDITKQK